VIYVLTQRSRIGRLLAMIDGLDRHFNRRYRYPVVIFHDDFTPQDMAAVRANTTW
jgi:hypothetical protein